MTIIRILNLGEFVTQNQMKSLKAFAELINPADLKTAMIRLGALLQSEETKKLLEQFKLNSVSEELFVSTMISKINEATSVVLTSEQFYSAWNAMNPSYSEFSPLLLEVLREHKGNQKIVFVSYTNPIDIKHVVKELTDNGIECTPESIASIPLHTTYARKTSKAQLILDIYKQERSESSLPFFPSAQATNDVQYIRGIQGVTDPILIQLEEKNLDEVDKMLESSRIPTILWNKADKKPFSEVFREETHYAVPAAVL